ncbi:GNAT family N-acyltransferase [Sulfitobacter sp. HNIBRBA3233]|uniref:GNAT family N-acetyltransferase n=1 Tax=Sulfitobacter marinivivus TaxID=3158558 RepID=UPI0032DF3E45
MSLDRPFQLIPKDTGRYSLCAAVSAGDLADAMALRARCFGPAGGVRDRFDAEATHVIVRHRDSGDIVCTFRLTLLSGASVQDSYAGQSYALDGLAAFPGPMLELGRFCTAPDRPDPDILRLAWAGMTSVVDAQAVGMLMGCASFPGTTPAPYLEAFALLGHRHLAPAPWRPGIKAPEVVRFAALADQRPDLRRAQAAIPPLLRTYLAMGGWVSDHAVIDREMDTLHVFTGLEIAAIPESRKRLLRALAG